jgi:hypothetical protein
VKRALALILAAAGLALSSTSYAQEQYRLPRADARVAEPHRADELVALMILSSTYGLRVGSSINLLAGRRPDDGEPETFWILPSALALALPAAAFAIDRRWPARRGRILTAGTSLLLGYVGTIAATAWYRGESFPSSDSIAGLNTFYGSTAGLALGVLIGHLTDATPGDAMYVAVGGVGGALIGALSCGITRCGPDLGPWALAGEVAGIGLTLATRRLVQPQGREMRFLTIGAAVGLIPAGAVMLAYGVRDGEIRDEAVPRISWAALGGLVVGAMSFYAIARATPDPNNQAPLSRPVSGLRTVFSPSFDLRPGGFTLGLRIDEG